MTSQHNKYPVFSIITPTFGRPEMLSRNIRSVISQTYGNYEHIIVDDGNDAITENLVKDFNDDRIVFCQHDHQKGAAAAYNTGINNSRGEFIAFLDDDDEYMPEYLERMFHHFSSAPKNVGFVWTGIVKIVETCASRKDITMIWPSEFRNRDEGLVAATTIGNGYGVCLRRKCVETDENFDEKLVVGSDTDFMIRLSDAYDFQTIPAALVRIYQHGSGQLTDSAKNMTRIWIRELLFKRYLDFFIRHPKTYSVHLNSYAMLCYSAGQISKSKTAFLKIMRVNPFRIRTYIDYISFILTGRDFFGNITAAHKLFFVQ